MAVRNHHPRGITVRLGYRIWLNKIIATHHEMLGREGLVRLAIEKPDFGIYEERHRSDRNVYYLRWPGSRCYVKVIVSLTGSPAEGEVVSAFRWASGKSGQRPIWPRSPA